MKTSYKTRNPERRHISAIAAKVAQGLKQFLQFFVCCLFPTARAVGLTRSSISATVQRVFIYVCGCDGLRDLHFACKNDSLDSFAALPGLWKVGFTFGDPRPRAEMLNLDKFAGVVFDGPNLVHEPGFDSWFVRALPAIERQPCAGVSWTPRGVVVDLPRGIDVATFDRAFKARLLPLALHHRLKIGELPKHPRLHRFTAYSYGNVDRISEVQEVYTLSMRRDATRLLDVIENVLKELRSRSAHSQTPLRLRTRRREIA